jgi:hypothetical protein
MKPDSGQRIGKHVLAAKNIYAIIELQLEMVFSSWSMQKGYKEYNLGALVVEN